MPSIQHAVHIGPLSAPERAVLEVVNDHPRFVWSTSLEDLLELAKWATQPKLGSPPLTELEHLQKSRDKNQPWDTDEIQEKLTINTRVTVYMGPSRKPQKTYSLRTIMAALSNLHHTGRIWAFKLYRRTHYGAFAAKYWVQNQLDILSDDGRKDANFYDIPAEKTDISTPS